jgi:DEAD/DEAH box helicase domain-containing protein
VASELASRPAGAGRVCFGEVAVTSQVTGYLRRDELAGTVWDETPLDLPERTLQTQATWWSVDLAAIPEENSLAELAAGLHGAEHAALGLLPIFTQCDRWDIRGHSMVPGRRRHRARAATSGPDEEIRLARAVQAETAPGPDQGRDQSEQTGPPAGASGLAVFVYDLQPGGAGFAQRAYELADTWLATTRQRVQGCECERGCPACIVSADCGDPSPGLDKAAAIMLLELLSPEP